MTRIINLILFSFFLYGCGSNPCKNCGCDNVDDCISKNKFEEARKYASNYSRSQESNDEQKAKIIPVEAMFWIEQKDLKRAETVANELPLLGHEYENSNHVFNPLLKEATLNKIYIDLMMRITNKYFEAGQLQEVLDLMNRLSPIENKNKKYVEFNLNIISRLCELGHIKECKMLTSRLPEKIIGATRVQRIENIGNYIEQCRRQYNSIKGGLKANEEIEPFQESGNNDYAIYVYEYPKSEALKIIGDCKK